MVHFIRSAALGIAWATLGFSGVGSLHAAQGPFFDPTMPVYGSPVNLGSGGVLARSFLVKVGKGEWLVYDQDLMRPAYWFHTDEGKEPLSLETMAQASWVVPTKKGSTVWPQPQGPGMDLAPALPGMGISMEEVSSDPRPVFQDDFGRGGLQASGRNFLGYQIAGDTGVMITEDGGVKAREWYEASRGGGSVRFARHLAVDAGGPQYFTVAKGAFTLNQAQEARRADGGLTVTSNHPGLKLELRGDLLLARLEGSKAERRVSLCYSTGGSVEVTTPANPKPRPAQWNRPTATSIKTDAQTGPGWAIDRMGLPSENPWERRVRPVDLVFLSPDRAAVATFEGDVWTVSISGTRCEWKRIAAGLGEPMSIAQVKGVIQVFTRNGIVRLRDETGDGETDFYENFSSLMIQTSSARGYALDMKVNPAGETFCSIGGIVANAKSIGPKAPSIPYSGAVMKISADGRKLEIVGKRLREPFFDVDPVTGRIACSDQQGNFVPASGIFPVTPGADFGYGEVSNDGLTPPVAWIPHEDDTSSASPLWMRGSAFKEWNGGLLDVSYGTGRLFLVRPGEGWPTRDGAVIPLQIETGIPLLHAHTHPTDGSLWLAGMRVYDSKVADLEAIGRLRRTKEPLAVPVDAKGVKEGVVLTFSAELDPASVKPEKVQAKEWQYRRSATYGSPRLKRDGGTGVDALPTGGTFLSKDGRSVFIHIPDLKPTMQLEIVNEFAVKGTRPASSTVYFTVSDPAAADWSSLGFVPPKLDAAAATVHQKATAGPATLEAGKELVTRYGCIACHSIDGATVGHSGPTWKTLYGAERTFKDGSSAKADDAYLKESILDPAKRLVKGYELGMGSYAGVLSEAEIESVILYLKSLK